MVGYGYVQQFLRELILLISENCFLMVLREINTTNQLVSDNLKKNLLLIDSTVLFQMILGPRQITYFPLTRLTKERHFTLSVNFIFPVLVLVKQM